MAGPTLVGLLFLGKCSVIVQSQVSRNLAHAGFLQLLGDHGKPLCTMKNDQLGLRRQERAGPHAWAALCSPLWVPWSVLALERQSGRPEAQCAALHRSGTGSHPCFLSCCSAMIDKNNWWRNDLGQDFIPKSAELSQLPSDNYESDIFNSTNPQR